MMKKKSIEKKIISIVNNIIDIPGTEIKLESSMYNTSGWDSLAHLQIISSIEDWIGRKLILDEIVNIVCIQDLVEIIEKNSPK